MAASSQKNLETDITTACPICFESFKTPRILPCMHTFCHNCLSSYILCKCKSKESPVGFPCPLCRRFVPAPSLSVEIEKWTELIPVNEIAKVLSENVNKLCDACTRAAEEIEASDWCESCSELLCVSCVKYHKRNAICKNHKTIPIVSIKNQTEGSNSLEFASVVCHDHDKRVKYLCIDHEELCCTKCVCSNHRKCTQIDGIEEAAENLRKSGKFENLSQKLSQVERSLVKAKSEGEDTIRYIEDTSDKMREDSTMLRDKIVHHVDFLLEKHLSSLAKSVKHQKDKVTTFVDTVSDRQQLLTQYLQALKCTEKTLPPILVRDYIKIKSQVGDFVSWSLSQMQVILNSNVSDDLVKILELKQFADTCMQTELRLVPLSGIDFPNAHIELIGELNNSDGDVTGGCFLENGDIVLAHYSSNRILQFNHFKLKKEINLEWKPRDVVCQSPTLLLTSKHNKSYTEGCVRKFDLDKFDFKGNNFFESSCVFSLAISSGFLYAACSNFIVKCDLDGNFVKRYKVEERTMSVAVSKSDELISTSCHTNKVTIMNDSGEKLHSYFHENLKYPYGLDINYSGNIFVAGKDSNNIHVLTPKAKLLKIFKIASPRCIKFKENSNVFFVGSMKSTTKVYEFRVDV